MMRIASHRRRPGAYTLKSGFDQCGLFLKPSQIRQWEASAINFTDGVVWWVDVTEQAHHVVMQSIGKHNLITCYLRIGGGGSHVVDLAGRLVDNLKSVLTHGLPLL